MSIVLALLPLLSQLIPVLITLIHTAEVAFSGVPGSSGQAKKDLAMQTVAIVAQGAQLDPAHASTLNTLASMFVDVYVKVANAVDLFRHVTPTVPIAPSPPVVPPPAA